MNVRTLQSTRIRFTSLSLTIVMLVAANAMAQAEPSPSKSIPLHSARQRVLSVQPGLNGPVSVPPGLANHGGKLDPLMQGVPVVTIEVLSDEAVVSSGAISGATGIGIGNGDAPIFVQTHESSFALTIKSSDQGSFIANKMVFSRGFLATGQGVITNTISRYEALLVISELQVINELAEAGVATVRLSLWDGDPLSLIDTTCSVGGIPAPIPGTQATFSNLQPGDGSRVIKYLLRAEFPEPVEVNCDHVYMVLEVLEGCGVGWVMAGESDTLIHTGPEIGFSDFIELVYECGQYGQCDTPNGLSAGFCCDNTGMACDHTDCDPQTGVGCECASGAFCTSGVADTSSAFIFGGTPGEPGYFASFVGSVHAATTNLISVRPVSNGANGLDADVIIRGDEMVMKGGNRGVILDFFLSNFDPQDMGLEVFSWQILVDKDSFSTGSAGTLSPWQPSCALNGDANCEALLGELGTGGAAGGCIASTGSDVCSPLWIDSGRSDYFYCNNLQSDECLQPNLVSGLPSVDIDNLWLGVLGFGATFSVSDAHYLATLALFVPENARGTFTIEPSLETSDLSLITAIVVEHNHFDGKAFIPLLGSSPAKITICPTSGPDCQPNGEPDECDIAFGRSLDCNLNGIPDECEPNQDCNGNEVQDICDIAAGFSRDCNANQVPDSCEIFADCNNNGVFDPCDVVEGGMPDENGNFLPDVCDVCTRPGPLGRDPQGMKVRYVSFRSLDLGRRQAIQVTLDALPAPYDVFNGQILWAGPPRLLSENSGVVNPVDAPGFPTTVTSTLQCEPFFTQWYDLNLVHLSHSLIVPDGLYSMRAVDEFCGVADVGNYGEVMVERTSRWGDVMGLSCDLDPCDPPDGVVNIVTDVASILAKFKNASGAVSKVRADLEPAIPDGKINFTDVTFALHGFKNIPYPFLPLDGSPCP